MITVLALRVYQNMYKYKLYGFILQLHCSVESDRSGDLASRVAESFGARRFSALTSTRIRYLQGIDYR